MADHADQEEDLAIEAAVSESFEDVAEVALIQLEEKVIVNVAKVLDVLFADGKRVKQHVQTTGLSLLAA